MLKKLKSKKLLQYEKYKGFKLNDAGRKTALDVIRKHRLWEFFLVEHLNFDWDKVHPIAEELEHISSEELVQRLDNFLGNPSFDPHGDPIPDRHGKIPVIKQQSISAIPVKKSVTVSSVSNQTAQMLEMLKHYKISLGTQLQILRKFEFDGSLEIKVLKQSPCIISEQVAKNVFVHYVQ
jgi:DtxR family Mn-dependent transcriptional regulator